MSHGLRKTCREAGRVPALRRRGTAAVELACVLPLLLLIVLGCIDFGRIAHLSIALNNAVGTGASYAATHRRTAYIASAWEANVRERVVEELQQVPDFTIDDLNIDVEVTEISADYVRLSVTATYPFRTVVDWPGISGSVLLRQMVVSRQFR